MNVHPKLGFHTAVGGNPTGIGDYIRTLDENGIPSTIVCADGTTGLSDALTLIEQGSSVTHVLCWRRVMGPESNGNNEHYSVPNYDKPPHDAAVDHWNLIKRAGFPQEVEAHKDKVWLLPVNELDRNRASWIGRFSLYFAQIANAEGWKVAMSAWTAGEPETEHWQTAGQLEYLRYCEAYPNKACVALHEYSYTTDGLMTEYPHLIGRFLDLFNVCDLYGIKRPKVVITEFGWTLNDIPNQEQAMTDLLETAEFYTQYPEVLGCAIWYLGPYQGIENKVQKLIAPVTDMIINNSWEVDTPIIPPPNPAPINLLSNPSFEDGWYHPDNIPELQIPNQWELTWDTGRTGFGDESWDVWVRPEVRTLPKSQLPPHEQELFVLDGEYCMKVFKGNGAVSFDLVQVLDLHLGMDYELTANIFPDLVMGYTADGQKIYSDDPLAGEWSLLVVDINENVIHQVGWTPFNEFGRYNQITQQFNTGDSAMIEIVLSVRGRYALANNGFFFDAFSLVETDNPVEPPPSEIGTVVYLLRPDGLSNEEEGVVWTLAHEGVPLDDEGNMSSGLHTTTYSFTDGKRNVLAGNGRSILVVINGEDIGTGITPQWMEANHPQLAERTVYVSLTTTEPPPNEGFRFEVWPTMYKTITQPFGANPDYYGQFGLPGHEGVDIRATHDSPLYAMFDGVISDIRTSPTGHNYGIFVRLEHESGYEATYAHMDSVAVNIGDTIHAGDVIGTADNTGNSSGDHLHLTLKHPDAYEGGPLYIGYPHNIVDPTPFLEPLIELQPPEPPLVDGWGWSSSLNVQGDLGETTTDINLRSAPEQSAPRYGLLPAGSAVEVHNQEQNGYLLISASQADLVEPDLPYTGPDWPVCYFGVHDRANRHPLQWDADVADSAGFNTVKHMSGVTNSELMMYNLGAMPFRLCRLFETWNNRHVSVQQFVDAVVPDIRPLIEAGLCEYFEFHNEPNLTHEGLQSHGIYGSWEDGAGFAQFFIEAKSILKGMFPSIKIGFPGVSPGPSGQYQNGHDSGWRMDHREFLAGAIAGIEAADFVCVHAYYGNMQEVEADAINEVKWYRQQYPSKLLFVSEHGNPVGGPEYQKGQQAKRFHELCKGIAGVGGTYYFLVSGDGWDNQALRYNSGNTTTPIFNGLVD